MYAVAAFPEGHRFVRAVESHQPLPGRQQVSPGVAFRRNERTLSVRPIWKASANFFAVSSSRAPMHGINITGQTNRALNVSSAARVTSSMFRGPAETDVEALHRLRPEGPRYHPAWTNKVWEGHGFYKVE
jgi:hypothetical protein